MVVLFKWSRLKCFTLKNFSHAEAVLFLWSFLFLRNLSPYYTPHHELLNKFNHEEAILLLWRFLFFKNLAPHYTPWTSKEILALEKLYWYFEEMFVWNLAPHHALWTSKENLAMGKLYCYYEGSFCYKFCQKL